MRWNAPVGAQDFQRHIEHTQCHQLQLQQSNCRQHNQAMNDQQCEKPVDFDDNALMDSGASFSSGKNLKSLWSQQKIQQLLMQMQETRHTMNLESLGGFEAKMWKDPSGMANVASFAESANQCHIQHDNAVEDSFHVKEWDGADEGINFNCNCALNLHHFKFLDACIN